VSTTSFPAAPLIREKSVAPVMLSSPADPVTVTASCETVITDTAELHATARRTL
jgi:hypothetical protein